MVHHFQYGSMSVERVNVGKGFEKLEMNIKLDTCYEQKIGKDL